MRCAIGEGALRRTGWVWVASRVSVRPLARLQGGTWHVWESAGFVLARTRGGEWCWQTQLYVVRLALGFSMLVCWRCGLRWCFRYGLICDV